MIKWFGLKRHITAYSLIPTTDKSKSENSWYSQPLSTRQQNDQVLHRVRRGSILTAIKIKKWVQCNALNWLDLKLRYAICCLCKGTWSKKKKKLERVFQISQSNTMTEKKGPQRNNKKKTQKTRTNAVRIKETPLVIAKGEEINKRN